MNETEVHEALTCHPFTAGLSTPQMEVLASCASLREADAGAFLGREGEPADSFVLIRSGRVSLELHLPQRGVARILTVGPGEVVGWSWLIPPHRWQFDAHAIERVRVIALNAACLRAACEANHDLGYEVCRRLLGVIALRLAATRVQLMDVYR